MNAAIQQVSQTPPLPITSAATLQRPQAGLQRVWMLIGIRWTLLAAVLAATVLYFMHMATWKIGAAFAVIVLLGLVISRRSAAARFAAQAWTLDELQLTVTRSAGAATITIPRSRVLYAESTSSRLERRFQMMRLHAFVAGAEKPAVTIPGLTPQQADWLRHTLLDSGPANA